MKEYIRLHAPKDEFDTDGGGKLTPEDVVEQEDGSAIISVRDGDDVFPIQYSIDKDGQVVYEIPEDMEDDDHDRLETKIQTTGQLYKKNMESNKEKANYRAQLEAKEAENARLKQELAQARSGKHRMTDEDAKTFYGVDSVSDVADLQTDDYAAWMAGNAKYAAQFATPVTEKTPETKPPSTRVYRATPPKTVDGTGGGGKTKAEPLQRTVNKWLAGVS